MRRRILICGANSLVGAELLRRLGRLSEVETIFVAAPHDEGSREQLMRRLDAYVGTVTAHIRPVVFDPAAPSAVSTPQFANSIDLVFNCLQRTVRDNRLDQARQANVRPIHVLVKMLEENPRLRLQHLSTAFIAGKRQGLLTEFDLNCGQSFNDAWEQTTFEAETFARASGASARITIYRPSHILGCADTGTAYNFEGSYPIIATLATSSILPGDPRARIDLVPVDFVAASMIAIASAELGGTFHLACGWKHSISVRLAAKLAAQGKGRPRAARLVPRGVAWPARIAGVRGQKDVVTPGIAFGLARRLLHQGPVFDTYRADMALAQSDVKRTSPESWLENVVRKAESAQWRSVNGDLRP